MKTKLIFDTRTNKPVALAITGDHSIVAVYATNEVIDLLGGVEQTFHTLKRKQREGLLPRMGSASRPLTMRDMELLAENERRGQHYWQYKSLQGYRVRGATGYDCVWGYGYHDGGGDFIIPDSSGNALFCIPAPSEGE